MLDSNQQREIIGRWVQRVTATNSWSTASSWCFCLWYIKPFLLLFTLYLFKSQLLAYYLLIMPLFLSSTAIIIWIQYIFMSPNLCGFIVKTQDIFFYSMWEEKPQICFLTVVILSGFYIDDPTIIPSNMSHFQTFWITLSFFSIFPSYAHEDTPKFCFLNCSGCEFYLQSDTPFLKLDRFLGCLKLFCKVKENCSIGQPGKFRFCCSCNKQLGGNKHRNNAKL